MKTTYETPELKLLVINVTDVITTSTGLTTKEVFDTSGTNVNGGTWGDLMG